MKAILAILKKEFIHIRRDPRMLPILFLAPIIQLLLLGYAVNLDVRDIPTVVCDQDRTPQSRDYLEAYFQSGYFSRRGDVARAGIRPVIIDPKVRVFYNPDLKSRNFLVPGVLGLILMIMTMMLASMGIVREKETGTLEQLIVTPIRPGQLILGKLLPFLVIGVIDVVLITSLVVFAFRVPFRGGVLTLGVQSLLFMLTTLGLGLLISTFSRNQQQAMLTAVFFMIPMILLSNFVFPVENMPGFFRAVTALVPIKCYFSVIRGIFLKGSGWVELWDEAVILAVFGAAILGLSVARFRKRLE